MSQITAIADKLLENVSNIYLPQGLVADLIFPEIKSKQKTGKLGAYGTNHLRIEHSFVAGRASFRRVEAIVRSSSSYSIESHGLEGLVTEDDYDNVELPFDAEKDETIGLTSLIQMAKEQAVADVLTSTSILTQNTTLSGTSQWNDYAASDPIDDINVAREAIYDGCGFAPNVAIMPWQVANKLAYSPQVLDALGFAANRAGQLSPAELAKFMGVDKLLIPQVKKEGAKEGQTSSFADVWGNDVVMAYIPAQAAKYQKSLGYKLVLSSRPARRVTKYQPGNPPNSTAILVDDSYDFLIASVGCGYLIKSAIA